MYQVLELWRYIMGRICWTKVKCSKHRSPSVTWNTGRCRKHNGKSIVSLPFKSSSLGGYRGYPLENERIHIPPNGRFGKSLSSKVPTGRGTLVHSLEISSFRLKSCVRISFPTIYRNPACMKGQRLSQQIRNFSLVANTPTQKNSTTAGGKVPPLPP